MTGRHLSFRPGNGRRWAAFRPMVRNGKRNHFPPFTGILIFSESGHSFRLVGNADSARSVHLYRRLIVKLMA